MRNKFLILSFLFCWSKTPLTAQYNWVLQDTFNVPAGMQVFALHQQYDTFYNVAYYVKAKLADKHLLFDTDTLLGRRMTPTQFYQRNAQPLVVVNGTFFSFEKNQNLNAVIDEGKLVSYNIPSVVRKVKGKDQAIQVYRSAIGISKKRKADVAWLKTDTASRWARAVQEPFTFAALDTNNTGKRTMAKFKKWKMRTAIGGGPALIRNGVVEITNDFELLFAGKQGLKDMHPRTAMGYTADGYLIIMAVQGRMKGIADGASLPQLAQMMLSAGCVEALNLDGGGSSCLLVNGKETIKPSDKTGQRAVPAVFMIKAQ